MASSNRLVSLDLLRLIAVLLVIGRHVPPFPQDAWLPLRLMENIWQRGGWMGVDLFFVLSGFLVSGLLFREYQSCGKIRIGRFLIRRGLKIYPAFYFFIIASYLVQGFPWQSFLCELLFVQNYGHAMWNHTWSLAVEEHFYLCLPLLLLGLCAQHRGAKDPFSRLPLIFAVMAMAILAMRIATALRYPNLDGRIHIYPTHLRIDSLFFGVLLSYFHHFHTESLEHFVKNNRKWLTVIGTAFILPPFFFSMDRCRFIYTGGFTLLYLGFGALMLVLLICGRTALANPSRWIRFWAYLGSHSYSIYLWHIPVLTWFMRIILPACGVHLNYWMELLVYLAACFGWGVFVALGIEFPMLRVRDRLFPSRSRAVASP